MNFISVFWASGVAFSTHWAALQVSLWTAQNVGSYLGWCAPYTWAAPLEAVALQGAIGLHYANVSWKTVFVGSELLVLRGIVEMAIIFSSEGSKDEPKPKPGDGLSFLLFAFMNIVGMFAVVCLITLAVHPLTTARRRAVLAAIECDLRTLPQPPHQRRPKPPREPKEEVNAFDHALGDHELPA